MSYNRHRPTKKNLAGYYSGHKPLPSYRLTEGDRHSNGSYKFSDYNRHYPTEYDTLLNGNSPADSGPAGVRSLSIVKDTDTATTTPLHSHDSRPPEATKCVTDSSRHLTAGTDPATGKNPADEKFDRQMHLRSYFLLESTAGEVDTLKNYRVVYDPECDKTLSKADRKTKHRKLRFQYECPPDKQPVDPRLKMGLHEYLTKPNKLSRKIPFKHLPQPRFLYDKMSLHLPPPTELVVWDLPNSVNERYLISFFESFGDTVKNVKFFNDPVNAAPLGIATFSFQGTLEKALRSAKNLLRSVKADEPKIDGVDLKIALNDNDNELLDAKVHIAQEKLRLYRLKRESDEKALQKLKKQKELEEEKQKQQKRQQEQQERQQQAEDDKAILPDLSSKLNTTTTSVKHRNKVIKGVFIPLDLVRYVKDRPFIFINNKYVPNKKISSLEVKKKLMKYDWTRVLVDDTGFYVVFNTLKECERCFFNEDGVRFFEYTMFMELCIPEKFIGDENVKLSKSSASYGHDVVDETTNMLIKELQTYLNKDIRERIIAPMVLNLLSHEHYPDLFKELQEQEKQKEMEKEKFQAQNKSTATNQVQYSYSFLNGKTKNSGAQNLVLNLPSFTKKHGSSASARKKKKNLFPMQHALNYDDSESEESEEDDSSRSATPVSSAKREADSYFSETSTKRQKHSKLKESFLYDESSDENSEDDIDEETAHLGVAQTITEVPKSELDLMYEPTTTEIPKTVFEEIEPRVGSVFDLNRLQEILRDDEDMRLAHKVLASVEPATVKQPEYWAWKQRQLNLSSHLDKIDPESTEMGILSEHLECSTGSFKSQGFRKIADSDKIEYLPHRRKINKPLETVQHDSKDSSGSGGVGGSSTNSLQSSRVNRANNRRFAADISAQKQILSTESDILNLNALTKRKKPVSYARSAIHNWGLYALEPIAAKEMIIEYVGESIRQQVAEHREKSYLRTGIGSSYLFRIDENTVIDATKRGGIARFINHCCNPSCTAKIIKVDGKKRIVIYALRDVEANEELTYDYKFERETNDAERIRCLCGAPGCKGYLN